MDKKKSGEPLALLINNDSAIRTSIGKKADFLNETAKEWVRQKLRNSFIMGGSGPRYCINRAGETSPIYTISKDNVVQVIGEREVKAEIHSKYVVATPEDINNIYKIICYELYAYPIDLSNVEPVGLSGDANIAWTRLPFTKEEAAHLTLEDVPEFKHIVSLCGAGARSLVLWIGSLLDAQSSRVQYLHIRSGGGNGKSTLFEAIKLVLGTDKVISADSNTFQDQYFGESLEGARLLLFADENNTSFISSSKFKRYTGEDGVTVNPKYKYPRYINFTHKTVILSNNEIQITSSIADVRRLISVTMSEDTATGGHRWWYKGLKNSGEKILAYCYSEYLKVLAVDPSIRSFIPAHEELIKDAIRRKYEETLGVFFEFYKMSNDARDRSRCSEIHKHICTELGVKRNTVNIANIKEALASINVEIVTVDNVPWYKNLKRVSINKSITEKAKRLVIEE